MSVTWGRNIESPNTLWSVLHIQNRSTEDLYKFADQSIGHYLFWTDYHCNQAHEFNSKMGLPIVQLLFASAVLIGALNASVFPNVADREPSYKEFAKMARFIVHRLGLSLNSSQKLEMRNN